MRKFLVLLCLAILVLFPPLKAQAQEPVRFSEVEVSLWPEYDRPTVLVIYRITLSADTTLPVNLSVQIPASVGEPYAVALKQPNGQLFSQQYERQVNDDWQTLSFTATMSELQIEYYDPNLKKDGSQRSFSYTWAGDHAADTLLIEIQQPLDATGTDITPGPVSSTVGSDDLTYFYKNIGAVEINQSFTLQASYQKESDALTVETQPVESATPLTTTSNWQSSLLSALPWLVGVLGLGLIGGGIYWYWHSGQRRQAHSNKHRSRRSRASAVREIQAAEALFCHHCGKRADADDRFCRACGTKLRIE